MYLIQFSAATRISVGISAGEYSEAPFATARTASAYATTVLGEVVAVHEAGARDSSAE